MYLARLAPEDRGLLVYLASYMSVLSTELPLLCLNGPSGHDKLSTDKNWLLVQVNVVVGALLGVYGKLAVAAGIPFFELVLVRGLALVVADLPRLLSGRAKDFSAWREKRGLLLLRGLCGFLSTSSWYWSLGLIPVSDVNALSFLAPVFVALLAPRLLGEPTSPAVFAAIPLCLLGVLLVAQPSLLFGRAGHANALGVAMGIAHALFNTGSKLVVRSLAAGQVPVADIVLSWGAVSLAGSSLMCAGMPRLLLVPHRLSTWSYIAVACGLGYVVQVTMSAGLKSARVAPAAACDYVALAVSLLADWLVFAEMPNTLSLCGAAVIMVASLLPVIWGGKPPGRHVARVKSGGVGSEAREPRVQLATESSPYPAGGGAISRRHGGGAAAAAAAGAALAAGRQQQQQQQQGPEEDGGKGDGGAAGGGEGFVSPPSSPWQHLELASPNSPLRWQQQLAPPAFGSTGDLPSPDYSPWRRQQGTRQNSGSELAPAGAGPAEELVPGTPTTAAVAPASLGGLLPANPLERTPSGLAAQLRGQEPPSPRPTALAVLTQKSWGKIA